MYISGSLVLIAVGAILRYAVADMFTGVSLPIIGLILMVVGIVGLAVSLIQTAMMRRSGDVVVTREVDPRDVR